MCIYMYTYIYILIVIIIIIIIIKVCVCIHIHTCIIDNATIFVFVTRVYCSKTILVQTL